MAKKWLGPGMGIAGLALCVVGGVGLLLRPAALAYPVGDIETPVAVIPPEVVALDGLLSISVTAPGAFDVRTARPVDAYAWAAGGRTSVVRGLVSWDEVAVDDVYTSGNHPADVPGDLWRYWRLAAGQTTIEPSGVEQGVAIVLVSTSGEPLGDVTLELSRDRGNGWAWPVVAVGLGLVVVGMAFVAAGRMGPTSPRARLTKGTGRERAKETKEKTPGREPTKRRVWWRSWLVAVREAGLKAVSRIRGKKP